MIRKIARPMLASVYIVDGVDTLANTQAHVDETQSVLDKLRAALPRDYAKQAPDNPELIARILGGTKVGAGSLLAIGKFPRLSAGLLAATTVPTIVGRYAFWESDDSKEKSSKRNGFLTHVALLGGLGITSMDTQGKPGLAWRASHAAQDAQKSIQKALPTQSESESALDNASEWISSKANQAQDAAQKVYSDVSDYVDENKDDWKKQAQSAAASAGQFFDQAREQGRALADDVQKNAPKWAETARKDGRKWLDQIQDDSKLAKKGLVKKARKAQKRAQDAAQKAEKKHGRGGNRAANKALKLQNEADKVIRRAIKKFED
ncbi:DoxX family protein [Corynebacterium yudongzhengii]|uniref:DoxX family membrane protein n=1 Tax=Corynebacterium yudongzhengii TaxID=2080740 RepID=A0A2U1T616_9CORY|nr:DoxX family protein [Corynebacterium yudongzhengii]AWB81985.1 DoxX family protein [Corynebacterium yudongzhengii]PWC01447.1 DoxX family membrane protein [Corynebacterium yudongzhengii]